MELCLVANYYIDNAKEVCCSVWSILTLLCHSLGVLGKQDVLIACFILLSQEPSCESGIKFLHPNKSRNIWVLKLQKRRNHSISTVHTDQRLMEVYVFSVHQFNYDVTTSLFSLHALKLSVWRRFQQSVLGVGITD
jgi:hypothetical protein